MFDEDYYYNSLGDNNLNIRVFDDDIGQIHLRNLDHWLHQDDERRNIQWSNGSIGQTKYRPDHC